MVEGLRGVWKVCLMIVYDIENGENVDFSRFWRSGYRTQNGGRGMRTSDMPLSAIEHLF